MEFWSIIGLAKTDFFVWLLITKPADGQLGFAAVPTTHWGDPSLVGNLFFGKEQYFKSKVITLWLNDR